MKRFVAMVALGATLAGCPAGWNAKTVAADVVTAAQFACIEATAVSDAKEVALACQVVAEAAKLTPEIVAFIEQLLGQRDALKAAGYRYDKATAKWAK